MQRFVEFLKKQSPFWTTTLGVALIFLLGVVDHLALPGVSFTLFYVLVVALVSWTAGKRAGVFVALLSATALTLGEYMDHKNTSRVWILYWNTGARVGVFLFAALTVSVIRGLTDALERKVEQRTSELAGANRELLQSKGDLEHQTELLTAICNSIGDGVVVADPDGKFLFFSPAAEEIVGMGKADLPPGQWPRGYGLFCPDKVTPFPHEELPLVRALRGLATDNVELFLRNAKVPDGRFLIANGRPLRSKAGEHWGGVVAIRDITGPKRAEQALSESHHLLRAVIEGTTDSVFVTDLEGRYVLGNATLAKVIGKPLHQIIGRRKEDLFDPETARSLAEHDRQVLTRGQTETVELAIRLRGDPRVFSVTKGVYRDHRGGIAGLFAISRDITGRKRLERQIIEISDREQARIGKDLHDGLCQQMVSIGLACNSLASRLAARSSPEAQSAQQMATLMDEALTDCRNVARGLYPVKLEAEGLTSALTELASAISARFDIACALECPEPVLVHDNAVATHLYRIALEAVSNAVRHGQVTQIIIGLATSNGKTRLTITDDGIGLSPGWEDRPGLGLHILHYRARMIGGTLEIRDAPAGGTIISCSAPQKVVC